MCLMATGPESGKDESTGSAANARVLNTLRTLEVGATEYHYHSLRALQEAGYTQIERLPLTLRILLENLLRRLDSGKVSLHDVEQLLAWVETQSSCHEISFMPARVLMQDFTGVPAIVDLAAMRDAVAARGGNPQLVNPLSAVDLVIDHSVMVDHFADDDAFRVNAEIEMERNRERYEFLRWGQEVFDNFRFVPPGMGICHQINLEYLGRTVWTSEMDGKLMAYPDTLVGTDSHTTMINGIGVVGWGV